MSKQSLKNRGYNVFDCCPHPGIVIGGNSLNDSFALEGCLVNDGKLNILNDGLYHHANIRKSYLAIYEFDE